MGGEGKERKRGKHSATEVNSILGGTSNLATENGSQTKEKRGRKGKEGKRRQKKRERHEIQLRKFKLAGNGGTEEAAREGARARARRSREVSKIYRETRRGLIS